MSNANSRQRSVARLLMRCLLALIVLFGLLEGGVRVMYRLQHGRWTVIDPESAAVNSRMYVPHEWIGQMLRPGAVVHSKGRTIHINTLGYRGPEFTRVKPDGRRRIVCLGGSTTFDVKVTEDERAWPSQLERRLRSEYGLDHVDVINAGTNGYAMPRLLIDLALRTLDVDPDDLICYPGINDLAYGERAAYQAGRFHEAIVSPPPPAPFWRSWLLRCELYNEINARLRYARQLRYGNGEGRPIERRDAPDPRGIDAFRRNLVTLAGICQAHGVRLALVTVRTAYGPDQPREVQERLARGDLMNHAHLSLEGHYKGYAAINRIIRDVADRFDLVLLDQARHLPAAEGDFDDSVHFNDAGAAHFAEFAADELAARWYGVPIGEVAGLAEPDSPGLFR